VEHLANFNLYENEHFLTLKRTSSTQNKNKTKIDKREENWEIWTLNLK